MVVTDLYWILGEVGVGDKLVGWLGLSGRSFPVARFSLSSFLVYKLIILPLFFLCLFGLSLFAVKFLSFQVVLSGKACMELVDVGFDENKSRKGSRK